MPGARAVSRPALIAVLLACAGCAGVVPSVPDVTAPPARNIAALDSRAAPRIERAVLRRQTLALAIAVNGLPRRASVSVAAVPDTPFVPAAQRRPVRLLEVPDDAAAEGRPADGEPVPVHDAGAWLTLLNEALDALTPAIRDAGASVDILNEEELFLYRDAEGTPLSVPMFYKPVGVEVRQTHTFDDLLHALLRRLSARHGPAVRLLFETGDDRAWGYPFVYADTGADTILFLQDPPAEAVSAPDGTTGGTLRLFLHTVTDHVRGVFSQPVSSVMRLFTLVGGTTVDMVQPSTLGLFGDRPVPPLGQAEAGMDLAAWEAQLDDLTGRTASAGRLEYLVDGATFFPRLIDRIGTARESVWLRVYIFDNDDYATGIADLLRRRAQDVEVRVLVDGLGTLGAGMASSPSLPHDHVPEPSITRYLAQGSRVKVRSVANVWLAGDHTKTILVDGETAFLGGMNIGREYRYDWHDLMVEVSGPVVGEIGASFRRAWSDAGWFGDLRRFFARDQAEPLPAGPDDYPVRLLYTRPTEAQILRAQIAATRRARQRIYLENPYLTSDAMIYELVQARRRGVDVRVILPYRTDSGLITRSNALAANTMLRHGIRVYIYPGMSHLKAAVYDGWACLGSANLDRLSLRANREMNLATSHAPAVDGLLQQVFTLDMVRAVELEEPLPADWSHYLAELLADYL
jgi:cardiolipin synthase